MYTHDFLTALQHVHLLKIIKNYHARHYIWEITKILTPALLTGTITFFAMRVADNKNKKRWLNAGYLKRKIELEIRIRQVLLNIKRELDLFPDLNKMNEIKNNLNKDYLEELNKVNRTFSEIKKQIKKSTNLGNMIILTDDLKDEYLIEHLIDEYLIFSKNQKVFNNYNKAYNDFLKTPVHKTKIEKDELGNNTTIGISQKDLESNELTNLIENIYSFIAQTEKIIDALEKNFEISNKS